MMSNQPDEKSSEAFVKEALRHALDRLNEQEQVLIACNYELYDGRWDLILHDLVARLEGRPYVFTLGERIRDDIERVQKLQAIEEEYGIKLGDYIKI
jgi:hypothetical protein